MFVGILDFLSLLLGVSAASMLPPAVVGMAFGETESAQVFLIGSGLVGFFAGAVFFALRGRNRRIRRIGGYLLTIAAWCLLPVVSALPLAVAAELTVLEALFEAVSGWTTTGATVLRKLQTVPKAVLFFRAELQWLGGLLTLMTLILVLGPGGAGGLPVRYGRSIEVAGGRERSSLAAIVRDVVGAYCLVTLACLLGLILTSVPVFDAVCLAFATVSTGGFMPRDGEASVYDSAGAEYVMVVFMLVGATSIFWHRSILQGQRHLARQHRESYFVIAAGLAVGFVFAVAMYRAAGGSAVLHPADALREGLFTGVSLVTTSGFESRTHGLTVVPLVFVLFVAFVGGGTFSTAGGIKQYRFGGMLVQAGRELMRLIYPHGVHSPRFGSQAYDIQLMKAIWSYFVVAIAVVAISGVLLALEGIEFEGALAVSVGAFANVTMIYSTGWPEGSHWPIFADMADASRMTLAATMILGRIEVLILLSALNPSYWRT